MLPGFPNRFAIEREGCQHGNEDSRLLYETMGEQILQAPVTILKRWVTNMLQAECPPCTTDCSLAACSTSSRGLARSMLANRAIWERAYFARVPARPLGNPFFEEGLPATKTQKLSFSVIFAFSISLICLPFSLPFP